MHEERTGSEKKAHAVPLPHYPEFQLSEHISFLQRSADETTHFVDGNQVFTMITADGQDIVYSLEGNEELQIVIHHPDAVSEQIIAVVQEHVAKWFDLDRDLAPFYAMATEDALLGPIVNKHRGLRIIGIPHLFESLCWAIIGQQINLAFAYRLKRRLVENYGEALMLGRRVFWRFPEPAAVAQLTEEELRGYQFSVQKARYIIGIARQMSSGELTAAELHALGGAEAIRERLLAIKGVGRWTADYVMMKTLRIPSAFPIQDVGLHNAIRKWLGMDRKPTIAEIEQLSEKWRNWEAYATFYLWRSLYE